jgi:catechol 2,3-dioxygenase-like lactoylglutathione lyase family enzyme
LKVNSFILNVTSEQPEVLTQFYRDVVALEPDAQIGEGAFIVGDARFIVDGHSETKGTAREPHRYLIDFRVDDIAAEEARLEAQGVTFIRKQGGEYWGGVISTFLDPDGNYCQLMEFKEQPTAEEPQFALTVEYVADIQAAKRFYVDVLGLTVQREHPTYVEFQNFAIAVDESLSGTGEPELFWLVPDAEAAFERLAQEAEVSLPLSEKPFGKVFGIKDPDGRPRYLLELAKERPSQPV